MVPGIWEPGIFDSNLKKTSTDWRPAKVTVAAEPGVHLRRGHIPLMASQGFPFSTDQIREL